MKKLVVSLLLIAASLPAQETGSAASSAASTGGGSEWENWTFAASALVTAAVGIFVVSTQDAASSHGH